MKILLIQPPHHSNGVSRAPCFSVGFGLVARALLNAGYKVEVFDIFAHQYSNDEVLQKIKKLDYDVAGIGAYSTQYSYVKWLISQLKECNENKIVIGGVLPSLTPETVLKNTDADICIIGEGEITFPEALRNIDNPKEVKGIWFKEGDTIIKNPPREYIRDLDTLGFPAWELFPMEIYIENLTLYNLPDTRAFNVIAGRGCPWSCNFCSKTFAGEVRLRSINNVIAEIKELMKTYEIGGIEFNDDTLVINKKRIYELCDKIEGLNIKWQCQGRVNTVDYGLLKRMKKAGCVAVGYGIESGSQTILDNMNKKATVEQAEKVVKNTLRVGLKPVLQMMYGYPGETRETLQETIDFFKRIDYFPENNNLSVTTPLPGTVLYKQALERGLIKDEDEYLEKLTAVGSVLVNFTDFSEEEFYRLRQETVKKIMKNYRNYLITHPSTLLKKTIGYSRAFLPHIRKYGVKSTIMRAAGKVKLTPPPLIISTDNENKNTR